MKGAPLLCWLDIQVQNNGVTAERGEENFSLQLCITLCAPLVVLPPPPSFSQLCDETGMCEGHKGLFSIIL